MARKRSNKKETKKVDRTKVQPIMQQESQLFQGLLEGSKHYSELQKQYNKYKLIKDQIVKKRTAVQKGEISMPVLIGLSQNMLYEEKDKQVVLKNLDEQIRNIELSLQGINGQILQYRDMYIEIGLRTLDALDRKFGLYKIENTINDLRVQPTKDEKVIFEEEFDEVVKNPKKFKEAKKKAVKLNARK